MAGETYENFKVFLELSRRTEIGEGGHTNRIPLFVDNISVNTSKSVMNMGVPFSGAIRGEATSLAFDMGMADKTISLSGYLLGQNIKKQKDLDDNAKNINLTSYEMAQLIHSYVDSSSFQRDQNLNKLVILMPSRVDHNFDYHDNDSDNATKDISQLKQIPFTWKNRGYDNDFASIGSNKKYFTPYTNAEDNTIGITGFIRSFGTTFSGTDFPTVPFTLEFEQAVVISGSFLD
tara:strand:+ start:3492 stop:4190 length:699 start_codon:yes stop_codon:yes gene_type:complete